MSVFRVAMLLLSAVSVASGCASSGAGSGGAAGFAGDYQGSFATALSPAREDDLNSCPPEDSGCVEPERPLVDIILRLSERDGALKAEFYRSPTDAVPLDLLGRGCGTRVGALESLSRDESLPDQRYTARFTLNIENRLCAGRLRPTSSHFMLVRLFQAADDSRSAEVVIDKSVTSQNYMYVVEDGVERRVRMDINNVPDNARRGRYRVCIEDDAGEFSRCVMTDKELKDFFLPVPVPGGMAANYTWWYDLTPNLKRTRGLYKLEQYLGNFSAIDN